MFDTNTLTPLKRQALRAALTAPLVRCRGGFGPRDATAPMVFTKRTVNALELDGLLQFVPALFPTHVLLTDDGRAIAQSLPA